MIAEKREARFKISLSQGVFAKIFNSSSERYSLLDSLSAIPFIFPDKSDKKYPSIKACFRIALKIEKYVAEVLTEIVPFLFPPQGADNKKFLKSSENFISICANFTLPPENNFKSSITLFQFMRIASELFLCRFFNSSSL